MLKRKKMMIAVTLAVVATLAVVGVALAGAGITSKSSGNGVFASTGVGGRLGSTEGHAVQYNYNYQGPAMPQPGFGGVSTGKVTVKNKDIVSPFFGTVGATYSGDIRCGQRTSEGTIAYWGMAEAKFGSGNGTVRGRWQYFAIAHDASQDPNNPNPKNDRYLFILSNIRLETQCPRFPDFFTYHPDEQPRGPFNCDFRIELRQVGEDPPIFEEVVTDEPNEACRRWNPEADFFGDFEEPDTGADRRFPLDCTVENPDACQVQRTLTAVWTGDEPFGCDGGLNKCSVSHTYVVGGGKK